MPTCRCDDRQGFTLVELLVVMAILGLLSAGAAQVLFRGDSGIGVRSAAAEIEAVLRTARSDAQLRNRSVAVSFDIARSRYQAGGAWVSLPEDVGMRIIIAGREQVDDTAGAIRFFPDGSSTGGEVHLSDHVETRSLIVDWLTGRVAPDRAAQ